MTHKTFLYALVGSTILMSASAFADINAVKAQSDGAAVAVTGTVKKVADERKIVLQDGEDDIDVDIVSNQSVVLKEGQKVTVEGKTNKGLLSTDIDADAVMVHKNPSQIISEAVEGNTNISFEGATVYTIASLPAKGLVKVSGVVSDVDNEKEFTLKDKSGSINVDIESTLSAALTEGAYVTVIGNIDNGITGKDINALNVIVTSSALPVAEHQE